MLRSLTTILCGITLFAATSFAVAQAGIFGSAEGIVHDPQHRPIAGARIALHAGHSSFVLNGVSSADGAFTFSSVPLGDYVLTVAAPGFAELTQNVTVSGSSMLMLHFQLSIASVTQSVSVHAVQNATNIDAVTPQTQVDRIDIARTPGASRINSLAMITDFVPGAYMTHDMLHMRGGHQLSWLIDGVNIPNTNIASNIGPQIDPKDIDTLEVERGSYGAGLGDRTYGMFNLVPRTGFERSRDAEVALTAGNFYHAGAQLSLGDHTEKFSWYASANGNRSNDGLQPAIAEPNHDAENGYGGFASFIDNPNPANQFRYVTQVRTDFYQIPYDADPNDWENQSYGSGGSSGLRDAERETDTYGTFTWLHTFSPNTVSQLSPFFHFNQAKYESNPSDQPVVTTADETGTYFGLQGSATTTIARNTLVAGIYGYAQHENDLFGLAGSNPVNPVISAGIEEFYAEDKFKPTSWLTLTAGERQTHFAGAISDDAVYPRIGAALEVPKLHWVFRAFYGHFYQPPPVTSISGSLLSIAKANGNSFTPLHGERDEEHQFGVQIPFRGWLLDADTFQTEAHNFLDHNNIGESSIFIPITIQGALIQAWEITLRSPHLWRFGQAHLAYSNQIARQTGGITGGLICFDPSDPAACAVPPGYSALDHDQRNTLNVGMNANLPHRIFGSFNVYYGSGFSNGDQDSSSPYFGAYLPSHATADLTLGKDFGSRYTIAINALNVGNTRVLLDNSLTFGGFHYNDPRQLYAEFRYRFKF